MMVGTLLSFSTMASQIGSEDRALTLAFTTFVLFQFFNTFNARVEEGSAFNRRFFDNPMLWWSLSASPRSPDHRRELGPAQETIQRHKPQPS